MLDGNKRIIDITIAEFFGELQIFLNEFKANTPEPEYVETKEAWKVLCVNSATSFNSRKKWGEQNGYNIRKAASNSFNLEDLKKLLKAYADATSKV